MIGVGSKVVCVAPFQGVTMGLGLQGQYPNGKPVVGKVYVVSGFDLSCGLILVGLPAFGPSGFVTGWWVKKFRELAEYRQAQELEYYKSLPVHQPQPEKI